MQRRNFLRVAGGGVILAALAGCSTALPPQAVQAWQGPGHGETDLRRWALAHALLAPHSHNLQSWLVDLKRPGEILLHCDLARLLPETDPFARQIMMSHGTFLEVLALAVRQRGHVADITLFPEGEFGAKGPDQRPVARIMLRRDASARPDPLFDQVVHRHTNRESYAVRAPDPAALRAVGEAVAGWDGRVGFTSADDATLARHRAIASEAWRVELTTPRTIMESYRLLRVGPDEIARHRDGISINKPMVRTLTALGLFDRSRAPGPEDSATTGQIDTFNATLAGTPAFFWMVTRGNDRRTQVNAGRAYVRAQLAATAQGLAMHPLSQALQEYPEQAQPYAQIHDLVGAPRPDHVVQMWTRLGYGPAIEPAPRRGLQAHLMTARRCARQALNAPWRGASALSCGPAAPAAAAFRPSLPSARRWSARASRPAA